MYLSRDKDIALRWARIGAIGVLFIPIFGYHFILEFIQAKRRMLLRCLYIMSIPTITLIPTKFVYKDVAIHFWGYYPIAGEFYFLFTAVFFCLFTWNIILLSKALKKYKRINDNLKAQQTKYLLFAYICAIPATVDFIVKYGIEIYPYGHIATVIFMSLISYAIIKHRFLDINIFIQKTLIYSIIIGLLFIITVLTLYITAYFFGEFIPYKTFWITLFIVAVLSFLFQPLYKHITSLVDKIFFKGTLPKIAEELQRSEKLAALGVLASGLAHEIKNPLAPIKTYIQNLPSNLNNPHYIQKIVRIIPEEVDKITDIINQLRYFANPQPLSISKVNINNLLDSRLNLLAHDFATKNITVEKHYSPTLPEINADPIQLERVFINLFLNAIDAMPNRGNLTITTEQTGSQISIKVSDTGVGITKEDLPHIFDPFYSKGKHKGTGLGLAVTHQIIRNHKGMIQLESTLGKGTTFYIHLPISIE